MLEVIPVIPPDLRPLVPLDGGRFATSDLNDLYRRVINRNNRLKRLQELNAPEIIIRNEKRMLQEAVDALFDNGRRGKTITGPNKRPLKSLSRHAQGQAGPLPPEPARQARRLLGPFGHRRRPRAQAAPVRPAEEDGARAVQAVHLQQARRARPRHHHQVARRRWSRRSVPRCGTSSRTSSSEHPVLLNRAPTLHRLGIQAFEPVLIEGKAIQMHPLVCAAFNADFDGDQMAVHVPLSIEAQMEARVLMMSTNNILSPAQRQADHRPVAGHRARPLLHDPRARVRARASTAREKKDERRRRLLVARRSAHGVRPRRGRPAGEDQVPHRRRRQAQLSTPPSAACCSGRSCREGIAFKDVNRVMDKKQLGDLIDACYRQGGQKETVLLADQLRTLGYTHATKAGISICIEDMKIPAPRSRSSSTAHARKSSEIEEQYTEGLITDGERYNKVVDIWAQVAEQDRQGDDGRDRLRGWSRTRRRARRRSRRRSTRSSSWPTRAPAARTQQIRQLAGMRGLMAKPSGEIIETPITTNFREGLSVLQYFISTHGARKGLADTALKTANSGYLTRRLVDVAQDAIITEYDCGTMDGIEMTPLVEGGEIIEQLGERILGRVALEDIVDPYTGEVLVRAERGDRRGQGHARSTTAGIDKVKIRSVLTCQTRRGICVECYGRDLARGHMVNIGEAVGVIAAQSIGEPGTQLTMRTFHIGGIGQVRTEQSTLETRNDGTVKSRERSGRSRSSGYLVVMNRHGELVHRRRRRAASASATRSSTAPSCWSKEGQKVAGQDAARPSGTRSRCRSSPRSAAS